MTDEYVVLGRKKTGGHLEQIAKFPTHNAAAEFSLKVNMSAYEDVWVEALGDKPPEKNIVTFEPAKRDSIGLRDALFDEIDAFRNGRGDPARANSIAKLAGQILISAKLEHEVAKYKGTDGYATAPMQLGRDAGKD